MSADTTTTRPAARTWEVADPTTGELLAVSRFADSWSCQCSTWMAEQRREYPRNCEHIHEVKTFLVERRRARERAEREQP